MLLAIGLATLMLFYAIRDARVGKKFELRMDIVCFIIAVFTAYLLYKSRP